MDENTRFVIERMDQGFSDLRSDIKALRDELDPVKAIQNKALGIVSLISFCSGGLGVVVGYFVQKLNT